MNPLGLLRLLKRRSGSQPASEPAGKLWTGGAITAVCRTGMIALQIATNGFITRFLDDRAQAGLFFTLWSAAAFLAVLGQMGLRTAIVIWIAEGAEKNNLAFSRAAILTTLKLTHLSYALIALIAWGALQAIHLRNQDLFPDSETAALFAVWAFTLGVAYTLPEIFRGFQRYLPSGVYSGLLISLLNSSCLALLWWRGATLDLTGVIGICVVSGIINYVLMIYLIATITKPLPGGGRLTVSSAVSRAFPMMVGNASRAAIEGLDTVLVGLLAGPSQAAFYGPASRVAVLINVPLQIVTSTVSPVIAAVVASGEKARLQQILRRASTAAMVPGLAGVLGFLLLGRTILTYGFGPEYADASAILVVLSCGNLIMLSICGSASLALMFGGFQSTVMRLNALTAVGGLSLVSVLALFQGATGASFAKAATIAALAFLHHRACRTGLQVSSHACLSPGMLRTLRQP